jgi:diguanylate cyclase (GGDEF)-like protein/PAS domain S-box-containing protein
MRSALPRGAGQAGNQEVRLAPTADIVVVYDVDGVITDCNEIAAHLLGYPAPDITGQPMALIIPPRLRSDHQALTRRLLDRPQVTTVDTLLLARDGSEVPVRLNVCPIKSAAGRVMALCEVGRTRDFAPPAGAGPLAQLGIPGAALWREIFHGMTTFVGIISRDGIVLEVNQAALDAGGLQIADAAGRPVWDTYWWSYAEEAQQQVRAVVRLALQGIAVHREMLVRMKGDQLVAVDCVFSPLRNGAGHVVAVVGSGVDVSVRKNLEGALGRSNRHLLMLSDCHHELTRASDETALLESICRVIVDIGGFRLAWVGFAQNDAAKSVRVVASAGADAEYLQRVRVSWDSSPAGDGPTGRAIRERSPSVCMPVDADPAIAPWRDHALARGYVACIALPLVLETPTIGALHIYSDRSDAFVADQVQLLVELADNLTHGISALRARAENERAQGKLQLFWHLFDKTRDLIYIAEAAAGRLVDVNETTSQRLGYTRDELLQLSAADISSGGPDQPWPERVHAAQSSGPLLREGIYRCKDGQVFPVEFSTSFVEYGHRGYLIALARDITERRRFEEQTAHFTRVVRMQSSINAAVLRIRDRDDLLREACRVATQIGGYDYATLWIVDSDGRIARPLFTSGSEVDGPENQPLPLSDGDEPDASFTSQALRTGELTVCNDLVASGPAAMAHEALASLGYRSLVVIPLVLGSWRRGALMLASRTPNLVRDEEVLLLQDIRATLALALEHEESAGVAEYLASFDSLAGLAKRALFYERLDAALRERPEPQKALAVAAFDIHGLANINDSFGRRVGDLLLRQVAERLKRNTESEERVGYLGGGTFVMVEPGPSASAENISTMLATAVFGRPFEIEGHAIRVSCPVGIARYPNDGESAGTLVHKAEAALKRAKDSGEQFLTYKMQMHGEIAGRMQLEHKLRTALDEKQFVLHYQPQLDIATGRIQSLEALIRWNDPESGLVMPGQFLPMLESSGLIIPVGSWVLARAAQDCRRWRALGLGPVRVAVNVAALQIRQRAFVDEVLSAVDGLNDAGYGMDIEITESSLLQDIDTTSRKLQVLRESGIRVALDDFGTGYSFLGLLSRLPLDMLKIDRSFISGLPLDLASVALTTSIIGLAAAFGLVTVAEGVETTEQLDKLRELNCAQLQGYLYSRPIATEQIELLLAAPLTLPSPGGATSVARTAVAAVCAKRRSKRDSKRS